MDINLDTKNGSNTNGIYVFTTNTTFQYYASGTIQTNGGMGMSITGASLNTDIRAPVTIITRANANTPTAKHHGIEVIGYGGSTISIQGTSSQEADKINVNVESGHGSAIRAHTRTASTISINNANLSGGYGDAINDQTAGLLLSSDDQITANRVLTVNLGEGTTINSGNDAAIVQSYNKDTINLTSNANLNGYILFKGQNNIFTNDTNGIWNLSNFGADGTTKSDIINDVGTNSNLINKGTIKLADKNFNGTTTNTVFNVGTFTNSGTIDLTGKNPTGANNQVGDRFTINGDYVSDGGSIYLNTQLDDARSNAGQGTSDLITITGNATTATGATKLYITPTANSTQLGHTTVGNGIKVVDIQGTSSADAFQLGRPVVAGTYEYTLNQGKADNSWYLSSYGDPDNSQVPTNI